MALVSVWMTPSIKHIPIWPRIFLEQISLNWPEQPPVANFSSLWSCASIMDTSSSKYGWASGSMQIQHKFFINWAFLCIERSQRGLSKKGADSDVHIDDWQRSILEVNGLQVESAHLTLQQCH